MKRCWFGGGLLVFLLIFGLVLSKHMDAFHQDLSEQMTRAAALAGEDRTSAQELSDQTQKSWERRRWLTAVLNDHAPMEQIEENFRLLTPYAEKEDFRETCLRLSAQLKALGEAQLLTLENLF